MRVAQNKGKYLCHDGQLDLEEYRVQEVVLYRELNALQLKPAFIEFADQKKL